MSTQDPSLYCSNTNIPPFPCLQMIQKTVATQTTTTTISLLAQKCTSLIQLKQLHARILKLHLPLPPLISFAATASNNASFFSYARAIFQNLKHPTTYLYNTIIRGCVQQDLPKPAILSYENMLNYGLRPNNYTFTPLIKACSMVLHDSKQMGFLLHAHVVELGLCQDPFIVSALIEFYSLNFEMANARKLFDDVTERDVVLWTAMIDGYGKTGEVEKARALFEEMPERNVISWSAMMAAYSRASHFKEVLRLYERMEEVAVRPNESVLVSVLTACAHLGALAQGVWIHSYAKRCGFDRNLILATALVDMYSKCGCVDLAFSVFEGINDKDSGAWNAIISGVALSGNVARSLELFDEMVLSGTKPTEVTFVAVLTACTHAKLVDKGLLLFEKMKGVYGIEPRLEHYACVVDLLARAGKLYEAEKFIEGKMGGLGKGDANVWGALLNACRTYGNVKLGNCLWRKLAEMGVADYGTHVLSYNMYKEAGWDGEANNVRRMIEETGLKKTPACSVIEVNGVVEEFLVGDLLNPKAKEISQVLDSLLNVMFLVE